MSEGILNVAMAMCVLLMANIIVLVNVFAWAFMKEKKNGRERNEKAATFGGLTAEEAYDKYLEERTKKEKAEYELLMIQIEQNQPGSQNKRTGRGTGAHSDG